MNVKFVDVRIYEELIANSNLIRVKLSNALRRIEELENVVELASWIVRKKDENGINVGQYRHMDNGNVQVNGDRWEALADAIERIEVTK